MKDKDMLRLANEFIRLKYGHDRANGNGIINILVEFAEFIKKNKMKVNRDECRILLCEWEAFKVDQKTYITGKEEMELFLDSRYGKEMYEANGIDNGGYDFNDRQEEVQSTGWCGIEEEQPFQGSREYLSEVLYEFMQKQGHVKNSPFAVCAIESYLDWKFKDESILKQIAEHKAKIEELKKQLR